MVTYMDFTLANCLSITCKFNLCVLNKVHNVFVVDCLFSFEQLRGKTC